MAFQVGQAVAHPTLGTGTVKAVADGKSTVLFDNGQEKMMQDSYLQPSSHEPKPLPSIKPTKKNKVVPSGQFTNYLAETGCYIRATVPPHAREKFEDMYEQSTGQPISDGTPGVSFTNNPEKSKNPFWYGLCVFFPEPPKGMESFLPSEAKRVPSRPDTLQVCSVSFVGELFNQGFVLGPNSAQAATDALVQPEYVPEKAKGMHASVDDLPEFGW